MKETTNKEIIKNIDDSFKDKEIRIRLLSKALAHYMFRKIIENAHSKYGISQEEMKEMNKTAANRARLFFEHILEDEDMLKLFSAEACYCNGWDNPELTDDEIKRLDIYKEHKDFICIIHH